MVVAKYNNCHYVTNPVQVSCIHFWEKYIYGSPDRVQTPSKLLFGKRMADASILYAVHCTSEWMRQAAVPACRHWTAPHKTHTQPELNLTTLTTNCCGDPRGTDRSVEPQNEVIFSHRRSYVTFCHILQALKRLILTILTKHLFYAIPLKSWNASLSNHKIIKKLYTGAITKFSQKEGSYN